MSFLSNLNPLNWIGNVIAEPIAEWQRRKTLEVVNLAKAQDQEFEIRLKKIDVAQELAKAGIQVEANWDARAQEEMKNSWKDEWFVILFSVPLILAFFPSTQEAVLKGFETLNKTPDWYLLLVSGIVAGVFGLRWLISRK